MIQLFTEVPTVKGFYFDEALGFGHRRLAIIDLTDKGRQPMESYDGRYIITYNGEIYNYKELRKELETIGYVFKSNSDTEVLLTAFCEWGTKSVLKFNGMFVAIWDKHNKS